MTLNEIVYKLRHDISGGELHQDFLSRELLIKDILVYRTLFIRRDIMNNAHWSLPHFEQTIPSVPLKDASPSEKVSLSCNTANLKVLDTDVPRPIRLKNEGSGIPVYATSLNSYERFPTINPYRLKYESHAKYTSNNTKGVLRYPKFYIYNPGSITHVNLSGIFEDPRDLQQYNDDQGNPVFTDYTQFPMPDDMVQSMIRSFIQGKFELIYSIPNNNPKETLSRASQMIGVDE